MSAEEQRRLAAIMFTDMVGYSALSQRDDKLAQELLEEHRQLLREIFPQFNGTEVKTIGDAFLVEFQRTGSGSMRHGNSTRSGQTQCRCACGTPNRGPNRRSHWRRGASRWRRLWRWSEHRFADRVAGGGRRDLCVDGRGTPDSQRAGGAV